MKSFIPEEDTHEFNEFLASQGLEGIAVVGQQDVDQMLASVDQQMGNVEQNFEDIDSWIINAVFYLSIVRLTLEIIQQYIYQYIKCVKRILFCLAKIPVTLEEPFHTDCGIALWYNILV